MFVILGYIVVLGSVLGGFISVGGHVAALLQPAELVIIFGSGIGAFLVANGGAPMKATISPVICATERVMVQVPAASSHTPQPFEASHAKTAPRRIGTKYAAIRTSAGRVSL